MRLRGSVVPEQTIAKLGAERLWELLQRDEPVRALGAMTGGQAVQMVKAGLDAIYLSGWQVAADANLSGSTYPGSEPLSGEQRAGARQAAEQRAASAPTRSTGRRTGTARTGSHRSSRTPRPASAAR